jgi:hypothetical protein
MLIEEMFYGSAAMRIVITGTTLEKQTKSSSLVLPEGSICSPLVARDILKAIKSFQVNNSTHVPAQSRTAAPSRSHAKDVVVVATCLRLFLLKPQSVCHFRSYFVSHLCIWVRTGRRIWAIIAFPSAVAATTAQASSAFVHACRCPDLLQLNCAHNNALHSEF